MIMAKILFEEGTGAQIIVLLDFIYLGFSLAGMKYDLKRLEEIDYDVNIRGLSAKKPKQDQGAEA